jgi:chemotaxis protein methyltransferase WspC
MNIPAFEHLLKQAMGLDAASIGSPAIERAVRERLSVCQVKDLQAYWEQVQASRAELQELIEAVVVPETWFFRDPEAFATMARLACGHHLPRNPGAVLRMLSLPCSTGEESFSMAMTLLDAGVPADRFTIDAFDISAGALAKAGRAVYGRNSFRSNELGFRDRHFEHTAEGYRVSEAVRRMVHFQQGNILAAGFLPGADRYDFIFCRNVLIYFDQAAQDRVVEVLERLLKPDGILFVGPSETGVLMRHAFVSMQIPLAFAFRKATAAPSKAAAASGKATAASSKATIAPSKTPPAVRHRLQPPPGRVPPAAPVVAGRSFRATGSGTAAASRPGPPGKTDTSVDNAERLANQGRLDEAVQYCEAHLRENGPSPKAFYILGLAHDGSGNPATAISMYRKALYLDPDHHEALMHLAFLLQQEGDTAGAQVLQQRVRRLQQKGKTRDA